MEQLSVIFTNVNKVGYFLLVIIATSQALTYSNIADNVTFEAEEKTWNLAGEEENATEEEAMDEHLMIQGMYFRATDGQVITHLTSAVEHPWFNILEVVSPPPREENAA